MNRAEGSRYNRSEVTSEYLWYSIISDAFQIFTISILLCALKAWPQMNSTDEANFNTEVESGIAFTYAVSVLTLTLRHLQSV